MSARRDILLICGGLYHDIDFVRLELLKLLAEDDRNRVTVREDYSDIDALDKADALITYTCEVLPGESEQDGLAQFLGNGKRWLALHGTNSCLKYVKGTGWTAPDDAPRFMEMLGSQFMSHPPIQPYEVYVTEPDHELVKDIPTFTVDDELYLCKFHGQLQTLLHTHWSYPVPNFVRDDWIKESDVQPLYYLHPYGEGTVLYLTLGHCRGKYDMQPLLEEYPVAEEGAWRKEEFYELLRRGIKWAMEP